MKNYSYEDNPLLSETHIRLIVLQPSENVTEGLSCLIQQQDIANPEHEYECISYTWGEPTYSHELVCNEESVFEITAHLHAALKRFRSKSRTRHLWADAVCIDQSSPAEKSQQIPLMAQIYRSACCVLVWLGDGSTGEHKTLSSLVRLTRIPFQSSSNHDRNSASVVQRSLLDDGMHIGQFFQLPWFSRRWIVQEIVLNPDVMLYCGSAKISWARLHSAITLWPGNIGNDTSGTIIRNSLLKMGELWRKWSYSDYTGFQDELFDLLEAFHHFACSDDKDRIYALAGLASDVRTTSGIKESAIGRRTMIITPDYFLSADELYYQVALRRIQSGRALSTLAYAGCFRPGDGSRNLPSWVPDFRLPKQFQIMLRETSCARQPIIEARPDRTVTLKGKMHIPWVYLGSQGDGIANDWNSIAVLKVFSGRPVFEPQNILQFVRDCWKWMHAIPTLGVKSRDTLMDVLCNVLVANGACVDRLEPEARNALWDVGLDMDEKEKRSLIALSNDYVVADPLTPMLSIHINHLESLLKRSDIEDEELQRITPFLHLIYYTFEGRCLFMSKTVTNDDNEWGDDDRNQYSRTNFGLFGIGPGDLKEGDVAVVFAGLKEPLFFRPVDGGHQVLGDGYFAVLPPTFEAKFRASVQSGNSKVEILLV